MKKSKVGLDDSNDNNSDNVKLTKVVSGKRHPTQRQSTSSNLDYSHSEESNDNQESTRIKKERVERKGEESKDDKSANSNKE